MPSPSFPSIRDLLADMIQRGHFCSYFFADVPAVYEVVCDNCGFRLRNSGYSLAECPSCHEYESLNPDPAYPTIDVRLDLNSSIAVQIRYNPAYLEKLAGNLKKFHAIITHLCLHILLDHPVRQIEVNDLIAGIEDPAEKERLRIVSTAAADFVVNDYTLRQYKDPSDLIDEIGFLPTDYNLKEGEAMDLYLDQLHQLSKKEPEKFRGNPLDGKMTTLHEWDIRNADGYSELMEKAQTPEEKKELAAAIEMKLKTMLTEDLGDHVSKVVNSMPSATRGKMPAFLKQRIEELIKLRRDPPWTNVLQATVSTGDPAQYAKSWKAPNRRSLGMSIATGQRMVLMPGDVKESSYKVGVIIDSSGSMGRDLIQKGMASIHSLKRLKPHMTVWACYADTMIYDGDGPGGLSIHKMNTPDEILKLAREGCGGTDFVTPIAQMAEALKPDILLYFTDGWGSAPSSAPSFPVVWVIPEGNTQKPAPYGSAIWVK